MMEKTIRTSQVSALQSGQGRDLVILHSLLTDRDAFDPVMSRLRRSYRVTRIDLPGFHESPAIQPTTDSVVAFLRQTWDVCSIGAKATLLGNGLGGTLALAFALAEPASLDALVLCDATAGFPEAGREPFRRMDALTQASGMDAIAQMAARRIFHDAYLARHPAAVEARRQVLLQVDPEAFRGWCRFLASVDLTPMLGDIRVPTQVICGELDQATPPALVRRIAESVPGATYCEIAGCGHCPPLENPDQFLSALTAEAR